VIFFLVILAKEINAFLKCRFSTNNLRTERRVSRGSTFQTYWELKEIPRLFKVSLHVER